MAYLPPALKYVLICVTFHWNVEKLIYLEVMMRTAATYHTKFDVLLVTNSAASLEAAVERWELPFKLVVWQATGSGGWARRTVALNTA